MNPRGFKYTGGIVNTDGAGGTANETVGADAELTEDPSMTSHDISTPGNQQRHVNLVIITETMNEWIIFVVIVN